MRNNAQTATSLFSAVEMAMPPVYPPHAVSKRGSHQPLHLYVFLLDFETKQDNNLQKMRMRV
jgi:hypothetical protein